MYPGKHHNGTARRVSTCELKSDGVRHVDNEAATRRLLRIRALERQAMASSRTASRRRRRAPALIGHPKNVLMLLLLRVYRDGKPIVDRSRRAGCTRVRIHKQHWARVRFARHANDLESGTMSCPSFRRRRRKKAAGGRRSSCWRSRAGVRPGPGPLKERVRANARSFLSARHVGRIHGALCDDNEEEHK